MDRPAYERDAYLRELATDITEVGVESGLPFVVTADTVFYAEGGGQPSDRGTINGAAVVDVQRREGVVRHLLEDPLDVGPAHQVLDWARRFDHMQQHTAQHLLTAVALTAFGWPTTGFHLGPETSDVDLGVRALDEGRLRALEDTVAAEIRAGREVTIRYADRARLDELGVRSRLLPEDLEATELRLVEIAGIDLNTCGGTHLRSTAEIGTIALLGTQAMHGGTRVTFVAGDRVRWRLAAHEARNAELRALLDTADAELPAVVGLRLAREKELVRERRRLLDELAAAAAARLVSGPEHVVGGHWDDGDMELLQSLARHLAEAAPDRVALLTAGAGSEGVFVVVAGAASGIDLAAAGPEVAAALGGRGGGRGATFQGKASRLEGRDRALRRLRDLHGE